MSKLNSWPAQAEEAIVDPQTPIIDAHHHLWRQKDMTGESRHAYELDDFWSDTDSGHNVIGTIFIECGANYFSHGPKAMRPVGETEYVAAIAKKSRQETSPGRPPILGIVSHADLQLGTAVNKIIEAHIEAGNGLFRGIRHSSAYYLDPPIIDRYAGRIEHLMMQENFRAGFSQLEPAGITFDAWLLHPQIPELTALARAFPNTTIIFNHFGGPLGVGPYEGKKSEVYRIWKRDISELASCDNVVAKLGGLAMPINGWGWDQRDLPASSDEIVAAHQDYYLHTIDCFSPVRCMFESNFPVDKLSVSYPVLWNGLKKIANRFNDKEKEQLFRGTAKWVYRLEI